MLKEHEYVRQTLERYTKSRLGDFRDPVLLTHSVGYVKGSPARSGVACASGKSRVVHAKAINCTLIDFGIGSPQAALLIHCLAYLDNLKSVIMSGMWGGNRLV